MKIKVLFNKKGTSLIERNLDLLSDLIKRYPNAIWRKLTGKKEKGYELEV